MLCTVLKAQTSSLQTSQSPWFTCDSYFTSEDREAQRMSRALTRLGLAQAGRLQHLTLNRRKEGQESRAESPFMGNLAEAQGSPSAGLAPLLALMERRQEASRRAEEGGLPCLRSVKPCRGIQAHLGSNPPPPFINSMTLQKSSNLSEPQFPYL